MPPPPDSRDHACGTGRKGKPELPAGFCAPFGVEVVTAGGGYTRGVPIGKSVSADLTDNTVIGIAGIGFCAAFGVVAKGVQVCTRRAFARNPSTSALEEPHNRERLCEGRAAVLAIGSRTAVTFCLALEYREARETRRESPRRLESIGPTASLSKQFSRGLAPVQVLFLGLPRALDSR